MTMETLWPMNPQIIQDGGNRRFSGASNKKGLIGGHDMLVNSPLIWSICQRFAIYLSNLYLYCIGFHSYPLVICHIAMENGHV